MAVSPWAKVAQDQPPLGPEPLQPVDMPDTAALPSVFASVPQSTVRQPTPGEALINRDQAKLQQVREAQARPWGFAGAAPSAEFPEGLAANHPGKLGKVAHVFSTLGNIAGDIFAPSVMERIPGTQLNRQAEEAGLTHRLGEENTAEAENQQRGAATAATEETTREAPGKAASLEAEQGAQTGNLESETAQRNEPSLAAGYAHAVNQAIKEGRDPATDPIVQHLSDAITSLQKQPAEKTPTPQEDVYQDLLKKGKTPEQALEATKERPASIRVETPGEQRGAKNDLLKAYQPTLDSAERMNVMTESYEKAIKDHDQQAMLNLLANHLGMTMGLQKGARLTKDIIHEAQASQPWLQGMEAKFDKDGYLAGVTLLPNQMRQMVNLGQERYSEDAKKSRSTAQYLGAHDDGPERIPGRATMNFYLGQTGGDAAKAKQLAAQDGWTVK
jgi:hypothetical protein